MNIQSIAKLSLAQRVLRGATSPFFARPQLLRMASRVTRNHASANALRNHVHGSPAGITNRRPTQRAPDKWESARFQAVCVA